MNSDSLASIPVAAGQLFQIDVRLNRPAHVYLLWINPQGLVAPVFPWKPVSACGLVPAAGVRLNVSA